MSRIAYVDGQYVPHAAATVHVEDRGYQFADGVYEVCAVLGGRVADQGAHLDRLARSLDALAIAMPMARRALAFVMGEVARRNRIVHGILYVQVTRGVASRDHAFPGAAHPVLVMTARRMDFSAVIARADKGVSVITLPDQRWARRDIKSTSLLPNVLAKQTAREQGAYEAWLVDASGHVTEGSSTNAWVVPREGLLVTHPNGPDILPGVTRATLMEVARSLGMKVEERPFTVVEAKKAREAFLSSTTAMAMPVVAIDGTAIGTGKPGPTARALLKGCWKRILEGVDVRPQDVPGVARLF
ncbi:MAG: D-amino-acid transaminase [Sphingomonadales bacterium]